MSQPTPAQVIWAALHAYRESCLPAGDECYDAAWDDICTAMAHIEEGLELEQRAGLCVKACAGIHDNWLSAFIEEGGLLPKLEQRDDLKAMLEKLANVAALDCGHNNETIMQARELIARVRGAA